MVKKSAKSGKSKKKKERILKSSGNMPISRAPEPSQTGAVSVNDDDIRTFVKKSLVVSGIRRGRRGYDEMGDAYAKICRIQLYAHARKVLDPRLIHHALLNNGRNHDAGEFRSGVSDLELGLIPKSEFIPELVEVWVRDAQAFVGLIRDDEPCEEDRRRGDELVLRLICIKPFDRANGRVARLYDNVFRVWCGFPWHIPSSADRAESGNGPVARYREEVFIPRYGKYL